MKRIAFSVALFLLTFSAFAEDMPDGRFAKLAGMQQPGMIARESNGIPHVFALNRHDLYFLNGWLHAQDRLWQMDTTRRTAGGTLGELVGDAALPTDVQLRTLGLYRSAEASLPTFSQDARDALAAYTDGVNAYATSHPLPPEYGLLGITHFEPWTPTDSVAAAKLIAFGLSFDLDDIDRTIALISYQTAGQIVGFDGVKLFFADTFRSAPFSSAATIPDATGSGSTLPIVAGAARTPEWMSTSATQFIRPEAIELARGYADAFRENDVLASAIDQTKKEGSNEWAIAPRNSTTGHSLVANDPHLSLSAPSTFYPISLRTPRTFVAGMGFPGAPFVIQGQNRNIAWGSTVHPMDVTDVYQEQLMPDAASPSGFSSMYNGAMEHVIPIPEQYRVNHGGTLVTVTPSANVPPAVLVVPRHGPVVKLDTATGVALTIQYTGFYPTHELEAFMYVDDAKNVDEFKSALQYFDVGSQNFAYADIDGHIAYFTSAELPVREDLQAMTVKGVPPFFIRNGQGGNEWMAVQHPQPQQAIPYEIIPYSEMPQVVDPSNGWFVNANNDPIGQTLDGDPLNTPRAGGGLLYLNPGYDGIRAGRITQMIRARLANGKISPDDMKKMQGDTVLLDAEVFVPFIEAAFANAQAQGADPTLAALGSNPIIAAAVQRLSAWDFSTPTGLANGYDASWIKAPGAAPSDEEIANSVAATLYAAWRSWFLSNTIDGVLGAMTLPKPPDQQALSSLRFQLEHFDLLQGHGVSGLNFFNVPNVDSAAARRDIIILKSLADGMTMLSSDAFAPAFAKSTNLDDYRWGKLHRVVFAHLLGGILSPGAPFGQPPLPTLPNLPGVSTDGGMSTVDASNHSARAKTVNGFMFGSGPNRRYVGDMDPDGVKGQSSLPGGVSGIAGTPWYTNLLMQWLTNDTFAVTTDASPIPWLR